MSPTKLTDAIPHKKPIGAQQPKHHTSNLNYEPDNFPTAQYRTTHPLRPEVLVALCFWAIMALFGCVVVTLESSLQVAQRLQHDTCRTLTVGAT